MRSMRAFSMTCSGAWHDHPALVVEALAPGAAGDLLEVAHRQDAGLLAVVLAQLVKSTVRMGTFMPTPSVSVPQMSLSRPCCASFSTSSR
jgi:hypothetical protein